MKRTGVLFGIVAMGLVVGTAAAQETSSKKQGTQVPAVAGVPVAAKPEPPTHGAPDTYGTTAIAYYRIAAAEFTPLSTNLDPYGDYWYNQPANIFRRYSTADDAYFVASPHLPSGATITYFELDACSTSSTSAAIGALSTTVTSRAIARQQLQLLSWSHRARVVSTLRSPASASP